MIAKKPDCILISDFNIQNLEGCLNSDPESPIFDVEVAPFGQAMPTLIGLRAPVDRSSAPFVVVWIRPEAIGGNFAAAFEYKEPSIDQVFSEVDEYGRILTQAAQGAKALFVATWVGPANQRGYGMLDMTPQRGLTYLLMRANARLAENLQKHSNIYLLDAQRWFLDKNAYSPRSWYLGKIPYGLSVFKAAAKDIKAAARGVLGQNKKLVIVDLDDTLWGGVAGDDGWQKLLLGGHDPAGEAYQDFQKGLKALTRRGIILAIVSKNEEKTALEVFEKHPEMILKLKDFSARKINWHDKAQNVVELASELNLGLQSVVFIDNHPVERARVREALPEVTVPEWPEDPALFAKTLLELNLFDVASLTDADKKRQAMYGAQTKREEARKNISTAEEWLKSIETKVTVQKLNEVNIVRAAQLLNKTNQMNLATRRMTEEELKAWSAGPNRSVWVFHVSDRFGDSGLTGLLSAEYDQKKMSIVDFILSCRVMGRKIEEAMLYTAYLYASKKNLQEINARFISTDKNKPCLDFWKASGFLSTENDKFFVRTVAEGYSSPSSVLIQGDGI